MNQIGRKSPTTFLRALVFVDVMRTENLDATAAKKRAMSLTIREVNEWFLDDEVDLESGEDGSPSD